MNGTIPPGEYAVVTQEGPREAAALWDFDPAYVSSGVKTGKSRSEQLFSGFPPEADLTADIVDVSKVPQADIKCTLNAPSAHPTSRDNFYSWQRALQRSQRSTGSQGRKANHRGRP